MNINFSIPVLDAINTNLARLVEIQQKRLALQIKQMTIDDSVVQLLVDDLNAAILRFTGDEASAAAAQTANAATIAALQTQLAPNPTLLASVTAALANAAAATPPVTPVVPVVPTAPALFDPTVTYAAGATVTDSTGAVWTAVTPVLGEAPGVTEGNWTLTTPAPAAAPAT
jgi:hypothetical protein